MILGCPRPQLYLGKFFITILAFNIYAYYFTLSLHLRCFGCFFRCALPSAFHPGAKVVLQFFFRLATLVSQTFSKHRKVNFIYTEVAQSKTKRDFEDDVRPKVGSKHLIKALVLTWNDKILIECQKLTSQLAKSLLFLTFFFLRSP